MDPHFLFTLSGPITLIGWIALVASPLIPNLSQRIAGVIVPGLFSIAYGALMLTNWADAPGGFGSLADVMKLFAVPSFALAGWLHYLAFDLLIGAWEVRVARREGIAHILVIPCLLLTFLFGPVGFILFAFIRLARISSQQAMAHG